MCIIICLFIFHVGKKLCIHSLVFGREGCCYDRSVLTLHGVVILEDLVITLADGISSLYLELISVDGNVSNEMNSLGWSLCTFSTRALQKLRNEVVDFSLGSCLLWLWIMIFVEISLSHDSFLASRGFILCYVLVSLHLGILFYVMLL